MTSLQKILLQIEKLLGAKGPYVYKKLDIPQMIYSTWKTGKIYQPRHVVYEKFRTEFGIDLYLSQARGDVAIIDINLFKACIQNKRRLRIKPVQKDLAANLITPIQQILLQIEAILGGNSWIIYNKLGVTQTLYSCYKRGKIPRPGKRFYEKFKTELGIDLYLSQSMGEVVIAGHDKYQECIQTYQDHIQNKERSFVKSFSKPSYEKRFSDWAMPLRDVLQRIEYLLGVEESYIYNKLGIGRTIYQSWKSGKRKFLRFSAYLRFGAELGIDLYQSRVTGEIVITDQERFEQCRKTELLTDSSESNNRIAPMVIWL